MTYCPFCGKNLEGVLEAIEKEKEIWQPTTIPYSDEFPYTTYPWTSDTWTGFTYPRDYEIIVT